MEYPNEYDAAEIENIKKTAKRIRENSEVFVVLGVGGSYLGAKAGIDMLSHSFYNELPKDHPEWGPSIYFAGNSTSPKQMCDLIEIISDKDISLNVISKSGTTLEPAIAFGILKQHMEKKYGKEARSRIYITTDPEAGLLRELAEREGYESFVIPKNIGGRYSVHTPVGLLPMAVSGIDIEEVLVGAKDAYNSCADSSLEQNICYKYATIRNILYSKGKNIEVLATYEPSMAKFAEWYKQLFGESEGKGGIGIYPCSMNFSTDLHSMGQYMQDGRRAIFETVLEIEQSEKDLSLKGYMGLEFLKGKTLEYVNKSVLKGASQAHIEGGVPLIKLKVPKISPYYFGYMTYFYMKACAMSGYILGVNPFDQPGVEMYKRNIYEILKP